MVNGKKKNDPHKNKNAYKKKKKAAVVSKKVARLRAGIRQILSTTSGRTRGAMARRPLLACLLLVLTGRVNCALRTLPALSVRRLRVHPAASTPLPELDTSRVGRANPQLPELAISPVGRSRMRCGPPVCVAECDRTASFQSRASFLGAAVGVGGLTGGAVALFRLAIVAGATALYGLDPTHGLTAARPLRVCAIPILGGLIVSCLRELFPQGRLGPGLAGESVIDQSTSTENGDTLYR